MSRPELLRDLRLFSASPRAIGRALQRTTTLDECRATIRRQLEQRDEAFVCTLEQGIYAHPGSPYRRLFELAGIELGDAVAAIREDGADAAASAFRDAGVYVTAHEFAGRHPIVRPGLELAVSAGDFDNPQLKRTFELQTGGSGGQPRPILVDFRLPAYDGMHVALFRESAGNRSWPSAMWLPVPPGVAGLRSVVSEAAVGDPFDRWFSQSPVLPPGGSLRAAALAASATAVAAARRSRIPFPRYVPPEDAVKAARWLARMVAKTKTGYFFCFPSSAVRVCSAAREHGYDISGAHFRVGSEPLTQTKQAEIHDYIHEADNVVWVDVIENVPADALLRSVAADPFDRGALIGDPATGVGDELDVDRVLDQRPEPLLAPRDGLRAARGDRRRPSRSGQARRAAAREAARVR